MCRTTYPDHRLAFRWVLLAVLGCTALIGCAQGGSPSTAPDMASSSLGWSILTTHVNFPSGHHNMALDSHGDIYVADGRQLSKFSPNGELITQLWRAPDFVHSAGLAVDGEGDVYVMESNGQELNLLHGDDYMSFLQKLSPAGQPLAAWVRPGVGPGQFAEPVGVAVDALENVYIADGFKNTIQKFSPSGQPLAEWGARGSEPGQFNEPSGIAVDVAGNVYVTDTWNGRVQKFAPNGQFLAQVGQRGLGPGQLDQPNSVAIDRQGNIYVSEFFADRVQELSASGHLVAEWANQGLGTGQFYGPLGVAVDGDNNLYVAEQARIQKLRGRPQPGN